jgi:IS6 family transposase
MCWSRSAAMPRAARTFFARALAHGPAPIDVTTDRAPVYPRVVEDAAPGARQVVERYETNRVEADHGRLKARLRPMRGVKTVQSCRSSPRDTPSCRTCAAHYEHTVDVAVHDRVRVAFTELAISL